MRNTVISALTLLTAMFCAGCDQKAATGNSEITIVSVVALPTTVGAGESALITCQATSNTATLEYDWEAFGAYGYLQPMGSQCIFTSPSCHSGPASVTVTVSDGNGSATASVYLNQEVTAE